VRYCNEPARAVYLICFLQLCPVLDLAEGGYDTLLPGPEVDFRMTAEETTISPELIEEQLQRLRNSPLFSHSRRYPIFLDYVVRKTLDGHQHELKERTVGVEALGRPSSYDLNADPIVRVTAGEVRKRLAQYYYEPDHHAELRIELHPGSYVPEFRFEPRSPATLALAHPLPLHAPLLMSDNALIDTLPHAVFASSAPDADRRYRPGALWAATLLASVLLLCGFWWRATRPSLVDRFWAPVTENSGPVLISVGSVVAMVQPDSDPVDAKSVGGHPLSADPIALSDAVAISGLQQVLSSHSRTSTIQSSSDTTFSDLQKGPVVLVSGFDNPWTMRLTDPLRFHLLQLTPDDFAIEDRGDPGHRRWAVNTATPFSKLNHDYGLVARYLDPTTEQIVVVAAGIGENGTIAASEFLSNARYLADLKNMKVFPSSQQNFEAVVETQIIDGKPGPPRVLATYTW
jgi:hypothetical protein